MFGYASFAEVPFAALPLSGGASFFEFLTENFGVDDNNAQLSSFLQSITQPITIEDFNSQAGLFFKDINEVISVAAANAETFDALQSITEPILAIESQQSISAQFAQSVTENVDLNDTPVPFFASLQSLSLIHI